MRMGPFSKLKLACLSFAGIVAGHLAAYAFVAPDPHDRAGLLESTGHGSWALPVFLAMALLIPAILISVSDRLSGRSTGHARSALVLGVLQVGGFVALEALERLGSGGLSIELLSEPAVLAGVLVNLLIAAAAPLLLAAVAVAVCRLVGRNRSSLRQEGAHLQADPDKWPLPVNFAWTPAVPRGPPSALSIC